MTSWWQVLWAAPAALGFALLFNVRTRTLPGIALLAILALATRTALIHQGISFTVASFVAALAVGLIGYSVGPWTHEASPVYAFAPVIPMIPGSHIFRALGAMVNWQVAPEASSDATQLLVLMASEALLAASVTIALAVGATTPMLLLPKVRRGLGAP